MQPLRTTLTMAAITIKGVPEDMMERLRALADAERRSLNQQAILLLERALAEEPLPFQTAYRRFRERHGTSPLKDADLEQLRDRGTGRPIDL